MGADKQVLKERLEELQEEYANTKDNKATNKYVGLLRAKMAKVRRAIAEKKSKKGTGFSVKKTGNSTVVLVGFPNAGKSSLLNKITNVESKVGGYAFTTLDVIPGMLEYNGAKVQVLDVPGLIEGAHVGKGMGTMVASVIRIADLLLFVVDATNPDQLYKLLDELSMLDIKVNKEKPKLKVEETDSGGIMVENNGHKIPDRKEIVAVLNEMGTFNAKVIFYSNIDADNLIAVLLDNAVYTKGVVALNKVDLVDRQKAEQLVKELQSKTKMQVLPISATKDQNIEKLKAMLFDNLGIIRVYLKPKDKEADYTKPFVVKEGGTIMDVARGLHSKALKGLKCAYVTGKSAKFSNQKVGNDHVLADGDVVTLVYEKF